METKLSKILFSEMNLEVKLPEFKHLKDISKRMDLVYNCIKTSDTFRKLVPEAKINKSNKTSEKYRNNGNDYFHSQVQYLKCLECYTRSVAFAEPGSRELALAYGNRSAVLFERGYYKESVEDINKALLLDHPKKEKLLMRKSAAESRFAQQNTSVTYYDEPPIIRSPNHNIPFASDSVAIKYNKKLGRHIIAIKDIEIGDVISAEPAFCHVIHSESKYIHCHHCLKLCYNLIPCNNCSDALYCSEKCMNRCYEEYHKFVCNFPEILPCHGMVFIKLALIGMAYSKKPKEEIPDETHKFKEILSLATNEEKLDHKSLCKLAIIPCIAYHVLKENPEFISIYDSEEDDKHLKELLYKGFLVNSFNPFNIKKINYTEHIPKSKRVATALYAFTSLYNHSCVQNCEFFHYGSLIVARAIAHIKKGQQVTICYRYSFSTTDKITRQTILKIAYYFDCECEACTKDWPTLAYLPLGLEIPMTFIQKCMEYKRKYGCDGKSNKRLLEDLLAEGKRLYYELRKCRPSQNLLEIQDRITELYTSHASRNVLF